MGIESIPVTVLGPEAGLTGNALPLLHEIAERLGHLARTGTTHSLDLSALPLTPADRDWLRQKLGTGEIRATLDADGPSSIEETAFPGVWWITHCNTGGHVQSEFVEICPVPELLSSHPDDIKSGYETLKNCISDLS